VLVLTRKSNESIMIGDEIEISILAISGEKARIGIEAPRTVPVFRKEVYNGLAKDERRRPPKGRGEKEKPAPNS
jgi:carbon storage regulator